MDLYAAEKLACQLFAEHLPTWTVYLNFSGERNVFGKCACEASTKRTEPPTCEIVLSKYLTFVNEESVVRNVLLHEIAHALAGGEHEHDAVWEAEARKLGIDDPSPWCEEGVGLPRTKPLTDRELTNLSRYMDRELGRSGFLKKKKSLKSRKP